jgi:hypothetical protein
MKTAVAEEVALFSRPSISPVTVPTRPAEPVNEKLKFSVSAKAVGTAARDNKKKSKLKYLRTKRLRGCEIDVAV